MTIEPALYATVALAAGLAGFTQGFAGFGSTLVAMPLLGLVLDIGTALPLGCLMALGINLGLGPGLYRHVRWRPLGLLLACSLPGMALGAFLLGVVPKAVLSGVLGAVVLYVALRILPADPLRVGTGNLLAAPIGLVAGCLGVCIGVNGPPVVAWAARQPWRGVELKATLVGYFLASGLGIVGVQAASGLVTARVAALTLPALPALVIGLWTGGVLYGRVNETAFRRLVIALLAATGLVLVGQALWQALAG
jgi:uncharacterized membrane protein YfcA